MNFAAKSIISSLTILLISAALPATATAAPNKKAINLNCKVTTAKGHSIKNIDLPQIKTSPRNRMITLATNCGEIVIDNVQTINYPHYFTPNGDGIHDTWNVVGLENEPRAKLYIFDRYGKLLKQLSTTGNGWDGTHNGYLLPSTDYWFKIEFPNLKSEWKEFKSHFSLKR